MRMSLGHSFSFTRIRAYCRKDNLVLRLSLVMALVKIVCPKCQKTYTIDPNISKQMCPFCGAPLFEGDELDLPNLDTPDNINSLENALSYGFRLLYFRSYDRLFKLSQTMKELYPDNYWTVLFELIGKTGIDFIFLIPKIDYTLNDEEVKEDTRARFYHYARRKYQKSPQTTFNKIAGYYPDIPGKKRNQWNKAKTKYDEKLEKVEKYMVIASFIRADYLDRLDKLSLSDDQKRITHNIKVWLDQVTHAHIDLYRYNQSVDTYVKADYDKTPNPGNRPVFFGFLGLYLMALATLVLSVTQIVLTLINRSWVTTPILFAAAGLSTALIITSTLLFMINTNSFRRTPVISVIVSISLLAICGAGIATAWVKSPVSWFALFSAIIALVALFFCSVKLFKYLPNNPAKAGTVIGNYQKLANNSFEVTFVFAFKIYQGEELEETTFSQDWISGE